MNDYKAEGLTSEWNEANFMALRLHIIQNQINLYKINLTNKENNKFHYQLWFEFCNALRGEGYSKWTDKEQKLIDLMRKQIEIRMQKFPAHKRTYNRGMGVTKIGDILIPENYEKIIELIQKYEDQIKIYNDLHGLKSANKTAQGLFR